MSGKRKTYKVFISSTYLDNAERRKLVEDAVIRADMQPVGMERFTASVHPTVEECERQSRRCDIYVGIIAHRYGWIPDGKPISITEMEYDAAKAAGRPRLMFEIDSSIPVDVQNDFDQGPDRWAKQAKLDDFRLKYRDDQMPAPFTETTLGTKVLHALNQWRDELEGKQPVTNDPKADRPSSLAGARPLPTGRSLPARKPLACRLQDQASGTHRSRRAVSPSSGPCRSASDRRGRLC